MLIVAVINLCPHGKQGEDNFIRFLDNAKKAISDFIKLSKLLPTAKGTTPYLLFSLIVVSVSKTHNIINLRGLPVSADQILKQIQNINFESMACYSSTNSSSTCSCLQSLSEIVSTTSSMYNGDIFVANMMIFNKHWGQNNEDNYISIVSQSMGQNTIVDANYFYDEITTGDKLTFKANFVASALKSNFSLCIRQNFPASFYLMIKEWMKHCIPKLPVILKSSSFEINGIVRPTLLGVPSDLITHAISMKASLEFAVNGRMRLSNAEQRICYGPTLRLDTNGRRTAADSDSFNNLCQWLLRKNTGLILQTKVNDYMAYYLFVADTDAAADSKKIGLMIRLATKENYIVFGSKNSAAENVMATEASCDTPERMECDTELNDEEDTTFRSIPILNYNPLCHSSGILEGSAFQTNDNSKDMNGSDRRRPRHFL